MLVELLLTYHRVNSFLASDGGELFRSTIEALVLFLVCYMVASEYGRERTIELRLMLLAFIALLLDSTTFVVGYAFAVLGENAALVPYLPIVDAALELTGILLLVAAFLRPRDTNEREHVLAIIAGVGVLALGLLVMSVALASTDASLKVRGAIELVKALIVLSMAVWVLFARRRFGRYAKLISMAFFVYAAGPLFTLGNIWAFAYGDGRLRILAFPFTILAVLLIFRVIYLRLVNKVTLQERLSMAKRRYEREHELRRLKDEFVSVVSHELRTPLTSINLYTGLLQRERLSRKAKRMVAVVKEETSRLAALVNDTLDLSKLEKRKVRLHVERVAAQALVERATPTLLATEKGVRVTYKIPADLEVVVDAHRFGQALLNLYGNAIKFTPKGGLVTVSTHLVPRGVEFAVSDTGIGIPKKHLHRVFEKFFQVQHHLTREHQGTGLGLAIVKRIVALHNGSITVTSREGKGTTFTIFLPQAIK